MLQTHKPSITLLIAENEKVNGKDVREPFVWKPTPHNHALWVYLKRYVETKHCQSIHLFVGGNHVRELRGATLTAAEVTAMQVFISKGHYPVVIRLVKTPGAPTINPAQTNAKSAQAARTGTTTKPTQGSKKAANDTATLEQLLHELRVSVNTYTAKHNDFKFKR